MVQPSHEPYRVPALPEIPIFRVGCPVSSLQSPKLSQLVAVHPTQLRDSHAQMHGARQHEEQDTL